MKTNLQCMGLGCSFLTKNKKNIIEDSKLEEHSEAERDIFMCDMLAREELLSSLLENELVR